MFVMNGEPLMRDGEYAAFRRVNRTAGLRSNVSAGGSVENGVLVVLSNTGTTVDVGNLQTFVSGNTD